MLALIVQDWSTLVSLFDSRTPSCGQREDGDPEAEAMKEPNEDRPVSACQLASVEHTHLRQVRTLTPPGLCWSGANKGVH